MKKALISLLTIYSINCYADTETINWYIDGNVYNTTQCESGGDVSLPPTPPERLGYTFTGWQEVFNRGTFNSWAAIPNAATGYLSDSYGSYTPKENDYIIVTNASDVPSYENEIRIKVKRDRSQITSFAICQTYINNINYGCSGTVNNGNLTIEYPVTIGGNTSARWTSNTTDIIYQGQKYTSGTSFLTFRVATSSTEETTYYAKFINGYPYTGTWRLRYVGNWADFGRGGWIPEKRLD